MKPECSPAVPLRCTKMNRHWSFTPRYQPFTNSERVHGGSLDTYGATTERRDDQGAAVTREDSQRHARVVHPCDRTCDDTKTRKTPCLGSVTISSSRECNATGSSWLVRHLFVAFSLLSVTSALAYCVPSGNFRVIVATAAFTLGPMGGAVKGTYKAGDTSGTSAYAGAITRSNAYFQREEDSESLHLNKEQRKAALLGLRKHQRIWPTFAHGKSKRGSIVVYRPLPSEAATVVYDPNFDLLIDAVLMDHLLQIIPPHSSFLVVIDLQHVADHVRKSFAPRHLAALHKQSSLTQFVKSLHWQMIRMILVRPLCEGVILINAPAVVLQVQPILEYILFSQSPGSVKEVLFSDDPQIEPNRHKAGYILHISEDEKALHDAVDASELPSEYSRKFTIPLGVRTGTARESGSLSDDYEQSESNFAEHGRRALTSHYSLGKAPEHVALSAAISATLLELDAKKAPLTTLVAEPSLLNSAKSEVGEQIKRPQRDYHANESTLKPHREISAGKSSSVVEKKGRHARRISIVTPQQKKSNSARSKHGAQEIMMEPQMHISVNKQGTPCDQGILPSDPCSTPLRGVVSFAGSSRASSLRCDTSTAPRVAQKSKQVQARRRSVLWQPSKSGHQDRISSEASTKTRMPSSAQRHFRRGQAARRTEGKCHQWSLTDHAHQCRTSDRKGLTDVQTSNRSEKASSLQPQKPTPARQSDPPSDSLTAGACVTAPATRNTSGADTLLAACTCRGKCGKKASADTSRQPEFTDQKQANKKSSSSRKKADTGGLDADDSRKAVQRSAVGNNFGTSHELLKPHMSDPACRTDWTDRSNFEEISLYADENQVNLPDVGKVRPSQAGPRSAENSVRSGNRKTTASSDYGSQDSSEGSFQLSEATWTVDSTGQFRDSNKPPSATRRIQRSSQERRPEDDQGTYTQNGIGRPTTPSPWTGYFWDETGAEDIESFDDIS